MKTFFAVMLLLAFSSPLAHAQGYDGLIAPPAEKTAPTQKPQAGYDGLMSWEDKSGGTAYGDNANLYDFVGQSAPGSKKAAQQKQYQAELDKSEEIKRAAAERRKANADALQKRLTDEQALRDKQSADSVRQAQELMNRQQVEQQRQSQQERKAYP